MDKIPANHTVVVEDKIVEGPLFRWAPRQVADIVGNVEDRDQFRDALGQSSQACLINPHTTISVEIKTDGAHLSLTELCDRVTDQPVINRPAVCIDI